MDLHDSSNIEAWLDSHPIIMHDYFLKHADISLVNKWLTAHGYTHVLQDNGTHQQGRTSISSTVSTENSYPSSPVEIRAHDGDVFETKHQRSNSKKHLRHDFAKSKKRNVFRTFEPTIGQESAIDKRRNSLKEMRQYRSLPPTSVNNLSNLIQSKVRIPRYPSKDIDHKRELRDTNEKEFFLEIVQDISNELDLKNLSSKISANVTIMLDADRVSLFLLEGGSKNTGDKPALVSKLFDIHHSGSKFFPSCTGDVILPWGEGVIGHVAQTGDTVNIKEASKDPRFGAYLNTLTAYHVTNLLCLPIRNGGNEVVGVVQALNKTSGDVGFTKDDEKVLSTYLTFCGISIHNAQIFEAYSKENERNQALLEVVHDLFTEQTSVDNVVLKIMQRAQSLMGDNLLNALLEVVHDLFTEQTSVDNVVLKIMQRAQSLLKCERCCLMLKDLDSNSNTALDKIFDLSFPVKNGHSGMARRRIFSRQDSSTPLNRQHSVDSLPAISKVTKKLAELVLVSGETINISDASCDPRCESQSETVNGITTRSILCKPVRNRNFQIIGVAQVVNRLDSHPFDEHDDLLFEAFAIFCGLGINNCQLYEQVSLAAARQAVALETLSYHSAVPQEEVTNLSNQIISQLSEEEEVKLQDLRFNDFSLDSDEMMVAAFRMFEDLGLIRTFRIDTQILCRWLLTVRKNYRNVAYHNWRHAFNVCQVMFAIIKRCHSRQFLSDNETLAMIVACLCHDLDHRGTNNAFQQKSSSALSQLYGTKATLEHHHFNHAIMIINSGGTNLFHSLGSSDFSDIIKYLKHAILATDLSLHIQLRGKFFSMLDSGQTSFDDRESKETFRSIMMTASDIAAITKPWEVQKRVSHLVITEFFDQGDKEKNELNIQPSANMDRDKEDEVAKLQLSWIDGICMPLYKSLVRFDPFFQDMLDGLLDNRSRWERLDAQRLSKMAILETGV